MIRKLNKYIYLILAICILLAAAIIENSLLRRNPETRLIEEFQATLIENEKELRSRIKHTVSILEQDEMEEQVGTFFNEEETLVRETGFGILIYKDNELFFWSDRGIAFHNTTGDYKKAHGLIKLNNGYYLADTLSYGPYDVVGLHLLKRNYSYENKYLQNNFFKSYDLPNDYIIWEKYHEKGYSILNASGEFLFTILPYGNYLCTTNQLYVPGIIYLLGLILLLFYFRKEFIDRKVPVIAKLVGLGLALFIVYWIHLIFEVPKVFFHLKFFGPDYFAINSWLPSLGDYFLLSLFFMFWLYNFG